MARAVLHMKSRKVISVEHPWTAVEWLEWKQDMPDEGGAILVCDEKGNQYIVDVMDVEIVMIPYEEENDGK